MTKRYIPQIREAAVPEEGGWTKEQQTPVLLLSIPEWEKEVTWNSETYQSVWLYDRKEDAYLFCFRLPNQEERAIAFAKNHAGLLLQDPRAVQSFSLVITSKPLEETETNHGCLRLKDVKLVRHPQAGW